jgi:predicted PolB exonuclease-like 3'-5' exonuclease
MIDLENRKTLVFDLEVVAHNFVTHFDVETKAYLLKYAKTDEDKQNTIDSLVFNPFTSRIVAIGMLDYKEDKGCVLLNTEGKVEIESSKENINYICGDEKSIVELFWKTIRDKGYNLFVTFNGREFDCPFIMLRSLILKIKPTFNLMRGSDFTFKDYHIDLLKELTFNRHSPTGARRKFSLDFYCNQLGIKSPKSMGVSGDKVGELFENKEYETLANYCIGDVIAEAELLNKWNEILNF